MTGSLADGQVVAARYTLQRSLGRGPQTETWQAADAQSDGRPVVLKFAVPGGEARLDEEHAIHAQLRHAAVLPAGRLETVDGRRCLALEYQPGGDFTRLRGRAWPFVLRRVLPVVDALAELHALGYVHGDVKPANVLLDADGWPRLADFSCARRIGATGASEGSPYGMSPERHAGAPASIADDVYAVGAMLYGLLGGHPPFYPDLTPERVRTETPAPLVARPAVPTQLADVILRCLAKDPAERPQDMAELAAALRECQDLPVDDEPATASAAAPRLSPPVEAAPIRPQWTRSTDAGPSARDLRREGFRRGLLVGLAVVSVAALVFVFVVLPGLMRPPAPATVTAAPAKPAPSPATASLPNDPADLERLAEQKRQADEQRVALGQRLAALEKKDVAQWGGTTLGDARAALAAADTAAGKREFAAALEKLKSAAQQIGQLEKQVPEVVRQRLADGQAALDAGRSAEATDRFTAVLRVDAANAAARAGLKRARVLDDVLKEVAAGTRAEQGGDAAAAQAAYRRALALDPATRAARDGLARLQARATGDAYSAAMSIGLAALARKDYTAARQAFERAGQIRPGAPEVADGLRQIEQAGRTRDIGEMLARARAAEREERWADALAAYRDALKVDPALVDGQQGAERSEPRAMLDAQLQTYLDRPDRLFSQEGRTTARNVLAQAQAVSPAGPRLGAQAQRLDQLLRQAETPIRIALASDNLTDVQIYRVGKLGVFDHRDVELMPGRYTVVGTRSGFRDVRKEVTLLPGAPPPQLVIRCEEPI